MYSGEFMGISIKYWNRGKKCFVLNKSFQKGESDIYLQLHETVIEGELQIFKFGLLNYLIRAKI